VTSHARPLKAIALATLVVVGVLAVRPAEAIVIYWWGHYLVLRIYVPFVGPIDPITDVIIDSPTQTLDEDFIPDPVITGTGDLGEMELRLRARQIRTWIHCTSNGGRHRVQSDRRHRARNLERQLCGEFQFRS
jgi:hypothetical protein